MRVIYRRNLEPEIEVSSAPQPASVNGVVIEWTINANRLATVSFAVAGVNFAEDASGALITYDDAVMAKVFAAAQFASDRIRVQTGFDVINPYGMVGNSPDEIVPETQLEESRYKQHVKRAQRSIQATAAITRPFDPTLFTDFDRLAIPLGHFARAQRSSDPLDKFEDYFKSLEYFAARKVGDDPSGKTFDKQLSEITITIDSKFDQARIETYRDLRRRVVHTRTTHALGHIGPTDMEGIRQVQMLLPEMEQLAWALLGNPPAFPR